MTAPSSPAWKPHPSTLNLGCVKVSVTVHEVPTGQDRVRGRGDAQWHGRPGPAPPGRAAQAHGSPGPAEGLAGRPGRRAVGEASLLPSPRGDKASPHPLTLSGWA